MRQFVGCEFLLILLMFAAGIATQEYAPVLPNPANAMGHNQLETNNYAPVHSPVQEGNGYQGNGANTYNQGGKTHRSNFSEPEGNDHYPGGSAGYNQGRGMEQLHLSESDGSYPKGRSSYKHAGVVDPSYPPQSMGHSNGYQHQGSLFFFFAAMQCACLMQKFQCRAWTMLWQGHFRLGSHTYPNSQASAKAQTWATSSTLTVTFAAVVSLLHLHARCAHD